MLLSGPLTAWLVQRGGRLRPGELKWGIGFGHSVFFTVRTCFNAGFFPAPLVVLLFALEKGNTPTSGQYPTLCSRLRAHVRDGLIGGSCTLRDCRRHSCASLTLRPGTGSLAIELEMRSTSRRLRRALRS